MLLVDVSIAIVTKQGKANLLSMSGKVKRLASGSLRHYKLSYRPRHTNLHIWPLNEAVKYVNDS